MHALTNESIAAQTPKLDRILALAEEEKTIRKQEKLDEWLEKMFPDDMDALHGLLRDQIKDREDSQYMSGDWFIQEVEDFLDDNEKMVLWGRGIRQYCTL